MMELSMERSAAAPLSVAETKIRIDAALAVFFTQKIAQATGIHPQAGSLWETMHAVSKAGGKRLRPHLLFLAYVCFGGKAAADILPAAVGQELLHIAMLIHDDIIDRDDIRYGVPNVTKRYKTKYARFLPDESEQQHFAEGAALLAGDALLSEAHALLQDCSVPKARIAQAHKALSAMVFRVAAGELLDMEAAFTATAHASSQLIASQKTASYSFICPLVVGAELAGANQQQIAVLTSLGEQLGIAYQLTDDLLGVFGEESRIGKSTSNDLQERKHTRLMELFVDLATKEQKATVTAVQLSKRATPEQFADARKAILASGAEQHLRSEIAQLFATAAQLLRELDLDANGAAAFRTLLTQLSERQA